MLSKSEYAVVESKEAKKPLKLEDLFPDLGLVSISDKEGACPVCKKDWENHYFMGFFLHPKHISKAEEYLKDLTEKLSETMYACIKVASNAGSAELTPKEMVTNIMEYVKQDPEYADLYSKYLIHFIPSQELEFQYRTIGDFLFSNLKTKFRSFEKRWLSELKMHKILGDSKLFRWFFYGLKEETKKGSPLVLGEKRLLQCVMEDNNEFYMEFLSEHELEATSNYSFIRTQFYEVTGLIEGFHKATVKFSKSEPYGAIKKERKDRGDRQIIVQSKDASKILKSL